MFLIKQNVWILDDWPQLRPRLILVTTKEVIISHKGNPKLLFENYAYLIKHQKKKYNNRKQTFAMEFTCSFWRMTVLSHVGFVQCMFCRVGFDAVCFVVIAFVWIPSRARILDIDLFEDIRFIWLNWFIW